MASPVNHWKLGFFVLVVTGAVVVAAIGVGQCTTHHATIAFYTYFDESVGGLDSGGRVQFRGVDVGAISAISIAPNHRDIEVKYELDVASLPKMGIAVTEHDHRVRSEVPADLRAQVGGNGLTGVKHLALDVLDPQENPPPALSFAVPSTYIPAATSALKSVEDSLARAAKQLPELVDASAKASGRIDGMLAELERNRVTDKAAATLEQADEVLASLEATIQGLEGEHVPKKASKALDDLRVAVAKVDDVLDRLDGDQGLIARMSHATDAVGQVGRGVSGSTGDLDQVLDELRDAAEAIRVLAEDLDRDPDMLIKGRASRQSR